MKRYLFAVVALCVAGSLPAIAQAQSAAKGASAVRAGKYHCVVWVGYLQTVPGFTIAADGSYRHDTGGRGRYAYDAAQSRITFTGGSLDKQAGLVEVKNKTAYVRLYNEQRSRTVIDCDLPG